MTTTRLSIALAGILLAGWSAPPAFAQAGDNDKATKEADQKFEKLLAVAQKDPKKADWKAVRHAYSKTSYYQPYDTTWKQEIGKVSRNLRDGNLKEAETALVELIKREHSMRIEGHALAVTLYEKLGDSEKARKHKELLDSLSALVFGPGLGASFEKPIEILFIDEEYEFLRMKKLRSNSQALSMHDGHKFDVLTTEAQGDQPEQTFYFNIDLPWNQLEASMGIIFEKAKEVLPKTKKK
jgi:Domain of unknown function (DUF4919)